MAKISDLPAAPALAGDERLPIVQGAETRGVELEMLVQYMAPRLPGWIKGDQGDTGPADNTYESYPELIASDPARKSARLAADPEDPAHPNGPFYFVDGAWTRQSADGVVFTQPEAGAVARTDRDKAADIKASADYASLQALADVGGALVMSGKDHAVAAPVVLRSGSRLRAEPGAAVIQAPGANGNLLCNAAYLAPWTVVTGNVTWVNGEWRVRIGWEAHGLALGDYVWLDGATSGAYRGIFPVIEVVDASHFYVRLRRRPTGDPVGDLRVKKADTDLTLDLGAALFDYNNTANNEGTGGPQTHTVLLAGIHNLRLIPPRVVDSKKFAICIGAVASFRIDDTRGYGLRSDLLKIYGPAWDGIIDGVTGDPGDDFVSLQCEEPIDFADYVFSRGDVFNVEIRRLRMTDGNIVAGAPHPMVSLYPSPNDFVMDNILIEDVEGYCPGAVCNIFDYAGGGRLGDLTIRRVNAQAERILLVTRKAGAVGATRARRIEIDVGPRYRNISNADHIVIDEATDINELVVGGRVDSAEIGGGSLIDWRGNIRSLRFAALKWRVSAPYLVTASGPKNTETIEFDHCDIAVAVTMFRAGTADFSGLPTITVTGGHLAGGDLFELGSTSMLTLIGPRLSPAYRVLLAVGGDAPIVTLDARGARRVSGEWMEATGNARIAPRSFDIVANLNASWIARGTGNAMRTNSETGSGGANDIEAGALVICQGAGAGSWKQLSAPTTRSF